MTKILLVEDSPATVDVMCMELRHLGYATILVAKDGKEAVQLASLELPDLIIMDISLPDMDGLTATAALRRNPAIRNIPILAATARARPGDRQKCLAAGCDEYLAKPFTYRQLGAAIKKVLEKS